MQTRRALLSNYQALRLLDCVANCAAWLLDRNLRRCAGADFDSNQSPSGLAGEQVWHQVVIPRPTHGTPWAGSCAPVLLLYVYAQLCPVR